MAKLLKASDAASLALHAMAYLAQNKERLIRTREIADHYNLSEAHLAKVLNRLSKQGLVNTTRGPQGGLALSRPAEKITLKEIYEAIEGPFEISRCMFGIPICDGNGCVLGAFFKKTASMAEEMMAETKLSQICLSMQRLGESGGSVPVLGGESER